MSDLSTSIQSQLAKISSLLERKNVDGDIDGLFSRFVLGERDYTKIEWKVGCTPNWIHENKETIIHGNYIKLASLGFTLFENNQNANANKLFLEGFSSLKKRDPLPGDRISFAFYPRYFIGLVMGARSIKNGSEKDMISWLQTVFTKRKSMSDSDTMQSLLYNVLEAKLFSKEVYLDHSVIESLKSIGEFSIVYWANEVGFIHFHNPEKTLPVIKKAILTKILLEDIEKIEDFLLSFVFRSVSSIILGTTDATLLSVNHVSKILNGFESAMKRWVYTESKKWEIENEYDVQSILYLILRSYFADIEYEDPTPKFGHSSSRLDLKIPQLKTIVEVKYARSSEDFKKIENEIKIDASSYVQSTDYTKIIVFIYDSSSSVQDHETTKNAMKKIPNIENVIIVSKPSHIK
ncbi:MAG: hypothetical protein ACT4NJ_03500 [Nitrosopumilaceae archaeon]